MNTQEIFQKAKDVKNALLLLTTEEKNNLLLRMADALSENENLILEENRKDLADARSVISETMLDRLMLNRDRINGMADGIRVVAKLPDPVSEVIEENIRPNGIRIKKIRVPMGVIGIIYESRPNVTSDAVCLSLKAGSAVILKSGKDAYRTAKKIVEILQNVLAGRNLPKELIQILPPTHEAVQDLMEARGFVDLLIPRGGRRLIEACVNGAKIPVLETGTGICHVFVDETADFRMALSLIENAKCSRPSVCNAMEVCLVHEAIAEEFIPLLRKRLTEDRKEKNLPEVLIHENEFDTEFLNYEMGLGVVKNVDEAISHINRHSTKHSECIVTETKEHAERFLRLVDSSSVYHNVSTRFTDGGEFGLGCEIGISTQKLHARGPMGLRELCTYKYQIEGDGQTR